MGDCIELYKSQLSEQLRSDIILRTAIPVSIWQTSLTQFYSKESLGKMMPSSLSVLTGSIHVRLFSCFNKSLAFAETKIKEYSHLKPIHLHELQPRHAFRTQWSRQFNLCDKLLVPYMLGIWLPLSHSMDSKPQLTQQKIFKVVSVWEDLNCLTSVPCYVVFQNSKVIVWSPGLLCYTTATMLTEHAVTPEISKRELITANNLKGN